MKITNMDFDDKTEVPLLYLYAGRSLRERDEQFAALTLREQETRLGSLTPQNLVRLALGQGFQLRQRGGLRAAKKPAKKARKK